MKRTQRSWNSTLRRTPFRSKPTPREGKPPSWRYHEPPKPKRRGVPPALRARVIDRDGGCQLVGVIDHICWGRVDPHHVWLKGQQGPDEMWNLVAVCRVAHDWIHHNTADAIALGFRSRAALGEYGAREAERRRARRTF